MMPSSGGGGTHRLDLRQAGAKARGVVAQAQHLHLLHAQAVVVLRQQQLRLLGRHQAGGGGLAHMKAQAHARHDRLGAPARPPQLAGSGEGRLGGGPLAAVRQGGAGAQAPAGARAGLHAGCGDGGGGCGPASPPPTPHARPCCAGRSKACTLTWAARPAADRSAHPPQPPLQPVPRPAPLTQPPDSCAAPTAAPAAPGAPGPAQSATSPPSQPAPGAVPTRCARGPRPPGVGGPPAPPRPQNPVDPTPLASLGGPSGHGTPHALSKRGQRASHRLRTPPGPPRSPIRSGRPWSGRQGRCSPLQPPSHRREPSAVRRAEHCGGT